MSCPCEATLHQSALRVMEAVLTCCCSTPQGIKITDAASKKKAKEALAAEAAMRKMEVESNAGWEEAGASDMEDN